MPQLLKGGFSEQVSTGVDVYQIRQPLGVVAGITPFNFPAMVPMWMFGNALACGNTFVLKPSEKDPSASLLLAELLAEAGVPAGVFNVVQGDKVAVDRLLEHPDVAAVSFVGSTPIARYIYETGTRHGKRVQALGGAKNHMVVLPDADIEMAADAAVSAGYGSAGERCMAISVVVAVGDGGRPARGGDLGPAAQDQGRARLRRGGRDGPAGHPRAPRSGRRLPRQRRRAGRDGRRRRPRSDRRVRGRRLLPRGVADRRRQPEMDCYRDEIFGPVLTVVRVDTYAEALPWSTTTRTATAPRSSPATAARPASSSSTARSGMVGINVPIPVPVAYYSFGGWKASLFGDTHMYGPEGINFYTRAKVVTARWPDPGTSSVDLGFPRTR